MSTRNVLVIGDTHIPFEHKGYLSFCKRIANQLSCDEVIHIGDLVDNHSISYHEHDPNGMSPDAEMNEADRRLAKWFKAFPKLKLCKGNHDSLVDRKAKTAGLPSRVFQQFRKIWGLPSGWKDGFEFIIGGVKYLHGTGYSGKYGHMDAVYANRMSCAMGHLHSAAGFEYTANNQDAVFGLSVGCGIDRKAYAYAYGKDFKRKPILGCGVVSYTKYGVNPQFFKMDL